jgi:chemotaxis methyl-accepting protein methylase
VGIGFSVCDNMIFAPDLSAEGLRAALAVLLRGGNLLDPYLQRSCACLDERFRTFVRFAPVPQWAPGLKLNGEVRAQHELYLPMAEIVPPLLRLCRASCLYPNETGAHTLLAALSWPDFLSRLQLAPLVFNPAELLRQLAVGEKFRHAFLCALAIPRSYGGSFGRYPRQSAFLGDWLATNRARLAGGIALLDAACGCGEGTYEAAEVLLAQGYSRESSRVDGTTLEPLELVAAAFGSFPNDPARGAAFRARIASLQRVRGGGMIRFSREDICRPADLPERYDVIVCNGLLGGPLLHGKESLAIAVRSLVARLKPGGVLLVADRFHQGWKMTQQGELLSLLRENLCEVVDAGEGVAGIKSGTAGRPRRDRRRSP